MLKKVSPYTAQQEGTPHGQEMVAEHAVQDDVDHGAVALDQGYADESYGYDDYGDGYDNSAMVNTSGMGTGVAGTDGNKGEIQPLFT